MSKTESQINEGDLRSVMGDAFDPEALSRLREAEAEYRPSADALSRQVEAAEISASEYALLSNALFAEFIQRAAEVIGDEHCYAMFDASPGKEDDLFDLEEAALEDTRRFKEASNLYGRLHPYSIDLVLAAVELSKSLDSVGLKIVELRPLLASIEKIAISFRQKGFNHTIWFVLEETDDVNKPYYPFLRKLFNRGYTLFYASDKRGVVQEIETKLMVKMRGDKRIEKRNEVDTRVRTRQIPPSPRLTNFCFLSREGDDQPIGFVVLRSSVGKRGSVAGWQMTDTDAVAEWGNLLRSLNIDGQDVYSFTGA